MQFSLQKMDFRHQLPGEVLIKYFKYQKLREEVEEKRNKKTGLIRYSWNLILKYNTCFTVRKSVCLHPALGKNNSAVWNKDTEIYAHNSFK